MVEGEEEDDNEDPSITHGSRGSEAKSSRPLACRAAREEGKTGFNEFFLLPARARKGFATRETWTWLCHPYSPYYHPDGEYTTSFFSFLLKIYATDPLGRSEGSRLRGGTASESPSRDFPCSLWKHSGLGT